MSWFYGMRLRGFSLGCQPMEGLVKRWDDPTGTYWDILEYKEKLTKEQESQYDLEFIRKGKTC